MSIANRIRTKYIVDDITGCWNWIGALASSGYGKIGEGGHFGRTLSAHRVAWEIENGPVPDGLQVLHMCDNKKCVNPQHLFVGTQKDNIRDCIEKGRLKTFRLTEEQVKLIKMEYKRNSRELGRKFGVDRTTIQRVVANKTWRHLC